MHRFYSQRRYLSRQSLTYHNLEVAFKPNQTFRDEANEINPHYCYKYITDSAIQSANGPVSMSQVQKSPCLIHFWVNPFFSFQLSGVIRNWTPQYIDQDDGKFLERNQLNRLQMVQFECPKYRNPCVSSIFGRIPFSNFHSPGVIRNWTPQYKDQDDGKILGKSLFLISTL